MARFQGLNRYKTGGKQCFASLLGEAKVSCDSFKEVEPKLRNALERVGEVHNKEKVIF